MPNSFKYIYNLIENMANKIGAEEYNSLTAKIQKADYKSAEETLKNWLEKEPENVMFLLDMGFVRTKLSKYEKAIENYKKVTDIAPTNPAGWAGLGFTFYRKGDIQKAIENFENSLNEKPDNAMIHFQLGEIYFEADNYEKAKKSFLKAIQFGDEDREAETMHRLIQVELGLDNLDYAIELANNQLGKNPELVSLHNLLGTAFYLKEEYKSAVEEFEKYLEKIPDDEAAKNILGRAKSQI